MKLIKKLELSDNLLQDLIEIDRKKIKKAIVFDDRVYEEIRKITPKEIKSEKIIPIKKTRRIYFRDEYNNIFIGYDSLDESFCVVCDYISSNLYLLKGFRYKNKISQIDIDYNISKFIIFIILLKLKKQN